MTEYKVIDGTLLKNMIINGTLNLKKNYQNINNLNVFPVPDGDTGTNMQMTMMEGVNNLKKIQDPSLLTVAKVLNDSLLLGSKGNSGVILSQFFSGIYYQINIFQKKQINAEEFIQTLDSGYHKAYKAVMNPVEGTILTVLRESIEEVKKHQPSCQTIKEVIENLVKYAKVSLNKTPMLLSVLKDANVVDSGGAGVIAIFEGMLLYLNKVQLNEDMIDNTSQFFLDINSHNHALLTDIKYKYCTEFIMKLHGYLSFDIEMQKTKLELQGDSLILLKDKELLKIHIHTNKPGDILTYLLQYGDLVKAKIDDMKKQYEQYISKIKSDPANIPDYALITFSSGIEMKNIFQDLQVDYIIDLNQKKSYQQCLKETLTKNKARNIIILPHQDEIFSEIKNIVDNFSFSNIIKIISTKNIAQCYNALLVFDNNLPIEVNLKNMRKIIHYNKIGEIICKDNSQLSSHKKDEFVAVLKEKIFSYSDDLSCLIQNLLIKMITTRNKFLTIFYHKNPFFEKKLLKVENFLENKYPNLEVEKIAYHNIQTPYIFSLE